MLVSDGTVLGSETFALPPYIPKTPDYAVEAEIQVVAQADGDVSLLSRYNGKTGYRGSIHVASSRAFVETLDVFGLVSDAVHFAPGNDWHTYRLKLAGNTLSLAIDGFEEVHAVDNRYLDARRLGLSVWQSQINVRAFRVLAVPQ
jgi:hypothetical protein